MTIPGNITTATAAASATGAVRADGEATAQEPTFKHSQFGGGTVQGLNASLFEEAAMHIGSSKKLNSKEEEKKEKSELQKLLDKRAEKIPDMPEAGQLDLCLQQLKEQHNAGNLDEDQIKQLINNYSGDSTHQYVALEDLIEYLQNTGGADDKALAGVLQDYNTRFYEENRQDIQAGLNVSQIAGEFAQTSSLGNTAELRDIWRNALNVPELSSPLEAYNFALTKAGSYDKVSDGIKWMTEALARELELAESERSADPSRMDHVTTHLKYVAGIHTTYEKCVQLEATLKKDVSNPEKTGKNKPEIQEGVLIVETFRLLNQRWISAGDIERIPEKTGIKNDTLLDIKIFIVNQSLELYRGIPDRYFKDDDHRINILESAQEALDDLIAEEEAGYDSEYETDENHDDSDDDLDFDF